MESIHSCQASSRNSRRNRRRLKTTSENNPSGIPQRNKRGETLARETGHKRTRIARAQAVPNKANFASPNNASEKFCFADVLWQPSVLQTPWLPTVLTRALVGGYTEWIIRLSWSSRKHRQSDQPTLCITGIRKTMFPKIAGTDILINL